MCFATPEQVVELAPGVAMIERDGVRMPILLHLLDDDDDVAVGDWLAVQAQRHAVAKLSADEAKELMTLYRQIGESPGRPRPVRLFAHRTVSPLG